MPYIITSLTSGHGLLLVTSNLDRVLRPAFHFDQSKVSAMSVLLLSFLIRMIERFWRCFYESETQSFTSQLLHFYKNKVWNCVLKAVTFEPLLDWKVLRTTVVRRKKNKGNADFLYLYKKEENNQILGQEILFSQIILFFPPITVLSVSIWSFYFWHVVFISLQRCLKNQDDRTCYECNVTQHVTVFSV